MSRIVRSSPRPRWSLAILFGSVSIAGAGFVSWQLVRVPPDGATVSLGSSLRDSRDPRESRFDRTLELARLGNENAMAEVVLSYVEWAKRPDKHGEREAILSALFDIEGIAKRMSSVLAAVAGDPTSPEDDPLWSEAVRRMAKTWLDEPTRLAHGRELMLLESRPRARRLLATSLAEVARTGAFDRAPAHERHAFSADLIDVYFEPGSESYRSEIESAIRSLSGEDAALVLRKGVHNVALDELRVVAENDRAVQKALDDLARE